MDALGVDFGVFAETKFSRASIHAGFRAIFESFTRTIFRQG